MVSVFFRVLPRPLYLTSSYTNNLARSAPISPGSVIRQFRDEPCDAIPHGIDATRIGSTRNGKISRIGESHDVRIAVEVGDTTTRTERRTGLWRRRRAAQQRRIDQALSVYGELCDECVGDAFERLQ